LQNCGGIGGVRRSLFPSVYCFVPHCFRLYTDTFELIWSTRKSQRSEVILQVDVLEGEGVQLDVAAGAGALREETTYTVLVRSIAPVVLTHRHPRFFSGLSTADGGRIVHGTVNFGSQVGYSTITVLVGGAVACTFRVEVYPSKIDYQRDYVALRDAVSHLHADLALGYLQRTYQLGRVGGSAPSGLLGWLFVLRALVDDLTATVHHITHQPHQRAERVTRWKATEHVRRQEAGQMLPALQKNTAGVAPKARQRIQTAQRERTNRLQEHAWLRDRLSGFAQRFGYTEHTPKFGSTERERRLQSEIDDLKLRLYALADTLPVPLDRLPAHRQECPLTLFEHAPEYREAYRLCAILEHGLDLRSGPVSFEVKDIHQLYEYWCYITVVQTAARLLGADMPISQLIGLREDRLPVRLWQGTQQTLTFDLGVQGTLTLAYNPRYSGPAYLVPQQPDIVLTTQSPLGQARYILDAKYRLDTSPGYVRRYGAPGPPRDALNDLHRYRDALREHDGASTHVEQAIVLFPHHDALEHDFAASRLLMSIETKGVGALPMLPNNTRHLEQWLHQVLTSISV